VKPRVFDLIVDDDEVYFEVKSKKKESTVISLADVINQITEPERPPPIRGYRLKKPDYE